MYEFSRSFLPVVSSVTATLRLVSPSLFKGGHCNIPAAVLQPTPERSKGAHLQSSDFITSKSQTEVPNPRAGHYRAVGRKQRGRQSQWSPSWWSGGCRTSRGQRARTKPRTKAAEQPGLSSAAIKYQPASQMLLYGSPSTAAKASFKGG